MRWVRRGRRNAIDAALERLCETDVRGLIAIEGGDAVNRVPDACRLEIASEGPSAGPASFDPRPLLAFRDRWRRLLAELDTPRDADFDPDHTVGNLGRVRIEGDEAIVTFDLRPVPGVDPDRAVEPLRDYAHLSCVRSNPPLETREESALVGALRRAQTEAGLEARIGTKATCTEAGVLSAEGIDTLVFGPGTSVGNVHRPNEHTRISDLERAVEIYRNVVRRLCIEEDPCSS
jgi:acetylornithine deacetylase